MTGLYYPDGSFKDDATIKRELYLAGHYPDPIKETPLPEDRDFSYWSGRFRERQQAYIETTERTDHAVIQFHDTTCLNFIGDIHAGSPDTDYARLEQEVGVICNTPNSFVVMLGDAIDGYFFNPAQMSQMEQVPEQVEYYRALIKHLSDRGKLLVGFAGDHCQWAKKMGISANARFARDTGAYYMEGVGYITARVCDQEYAITGVHRPQGHSIYNNAHGAMRLGRDAEGSDIVVTAHQHAKAVTQQPVKEYGGGSRIITYVAVGTYKKGDDFSRKMGFADNSCNAMYGASVILDKNTHRVTSYYDVLEANALLGAR